jgi:hypothetical protein
MAISYMNMNNAVEATKQYRAARMCLLTANAIDQIKHADLLRSLALAIEGCYIQKKSLSVTDADKVEEAINCMRTSAAIFEQAFGKEHENSVKLASDLNDIKRRATVKRVEMAKVNMAQKSIEIEQEKNNWLIEQEKSNQVKGKGKGKSKSKGKK